MLCRFYNICPTMWKFGHNKPFQVWQIYEQMSDRREPLTSDHGTLPTHKGCIADSDWKGKHSFAMMSQTMTFVGKHKYLMLPLLAIYYACDAIASLYIGAGCVCYEAVKGDSPIVCSNSSTTRPEFSPIITSKNFKAISDLWKRHEEFSVEVSNAIRKGMLSSFDYKYFIFVFTMIELLLIQSLFVCRPSGRRQ
jgi:hypothetical protein